uniref:Laminin, gamma 3 n=1 Tax=Salarias fasciatus TaxID=181472 RepID=A0A672HK63_SALFA
MDASLLLSLLLSLHLHLAVRAAMDSCYDDEGRPNRCMPKFENVAFNRTVVASNVCGSPPEDYCMQTGSTRSCHVCDAADPERSHNVSLLTDFNRNDEPTWWQSQSMYYGIQHPNSVNLTLHLGKAFEITYIRLKFYTSRPESFAIYKRTEEDGSWLPYQYYSASCRKTYGKDAKGYIRPGDDERIAVCTDEFSDISPLTGGNVAFSTLEGRPSAYNFDKSLMLQEWVTASDLLISLDRLNTFGDEFFKDSKVLRSYFYAISDFSVGGRCKCNGHASECTEGEHGGLACACQHNTEGADCQRCRPFYQDRPWARATGDSANECLKCNCSGRSDECVFDAEQYRSTGSGGRCLSCRDNTDGPHCESCRENHYRNSPEEPCLPCNCNVNGSVSLQCDAEGRCVCRDGVTGEKCDTCRAGFHSLGPGGCRPCECDPSGSVDSCSPLDGRCFCKPNVEGQSCDRCRPGFFNLQQVNPAGCQPCFCFGHSLACSSSHRYAAVNITSDFLEDQDGWWGQFSGGMEYPLQWKEGEVYLLPLTEDDVGFYKAPEKFLGQRVHSYGQPLSITFTSETPELLPDHVSLLLQGAGIALSADLASRPALPSDPGHAPRRSFVVRLHEIEGRFKPSLSAFEFQHLLYNLTALKISNAGGHNYTSQLAGVTLTSAFIPSGPASPAAPWVESCSCPLGFTGQFCERCLSGFTREDPSRGPLSPCVPCNCHQHGSCHPETGVCECSHFTAGVTCERCLGGYHGNALIGTPGDCRPCPCPDGTSCAQIAETGQVVCTDCPAGQTGTRCQMCEDGYYGDPLGQSGPARPCARCDCNGNVDLNAVGVCDRVTGRCLKCLGHTEGDDCQRCRRGFYGDARVRTAGPKCRPCSCSPAGTAGRADECHPQTGNCLCLGHVTGRDCGRCEVGFFNLQPGIGCEMCKCNPIGSSSMACHPISGQCVCRAGVEGSLCDSCRVGFFGFSSRGCRACDCDPMGSVSMQCHSNGTCHCRQGFVGYKCDKCELNYFHDRETHQCEECPACYGLVKKQAEKLRTRLQDLEKLLARFDCRGRFGKHPHLLKYHMARLSEHEHQGEDTLPNALEDFLAFQEAREAFIKQFSLLEASSGTLLAQLHDITSALNCSISAAEEEGNETRKDESGRGVCQTFTGTLLTIAASQKQLKQATLDLHRTIIPFELVSGPNKWSNMVNESQVLMKSHEEAADHIEAVAARALTASKQTFGLLMDLLQDNSTEEYIRNLTRHDLARRTEELDQDIQAKDSIVDKLKEEAQPLIQTASKNMESMEDIRKVNSSSCLNFSSKLHDKKKKSFCLLYMAAEWPRRQSQTKVALKKEKPLEEKVLADVRRKVSQIEKMIKPALENASLAGNTSKEAELTAGAVAEVRVLCFHPPEAIVKMTLPTIQVFLLGSQGEVSLTGVKRDMEAAQLQLEAYSAALTELISKIGKPLSRMIFIRFDRILNETARRLSALRGSVESPALGAKIQRLHSAAREQRSRLSAMEQDIQEITEERDSLRDIASNLPESCPQA